MDIAKKVRQFLSQPNIGHQTFRVPGVGQGFNNVPQQRPIQQKSFANNLAQKAIIEGFKFYNNTKLPVNTYVPNVPALGLIKATPKQFSNTAAGLVRPFTRTVGGLEQDAVNRFLLNPRGASVDQVQFQHPITKFVFGSEPIKPLVPQVRGYLEKPYVKNPITGETKYSKTKLSKGQAAAVAPLAALGIGVLNYPGNPTSLGKTGGVQGVKALARESKDVGEFMAVLKNNKPLLQEAIGIIKDTKNTYGSLEDIFRGYRFGEGLNKAKLAKKNEQFVKELQIERGLNNNLGAKLNADLPSFQELTTPEGIKKLIRIAKDESGAINLGAKVSLKKSQVPDVSQAKLSSEAIIPQKVSMKGNVAAQIDKEINGGVKSGSASLKLNPQQQVAQGLSQNLPEAQRATSVFPSSHMNPENVVSLPGSIAESFNTSNLNVPIKAKESIKESIQAIKPNIEAKVGATLTNKEAKQFADQSSKILKKSISREDTLKWEAALLNARKQLAQQSQDGKVTPEYLDNLLAIKTLGTDIGRKLQSFSIAADPSEITAKQAILEAILKVNKNTDEILAASKNYDLNDPEQATEFYRNFVKPTTGEWVDLLRYNSMLSSPNTQIVNAVSNYQGSGIIAPIEKTALGGVDFLKSALTGSKREYFAGEGLAYGKGYYSNLGNAARKFAETMRGGSIIQNPDIRSIPLTTGGKARVVENTLAIPLKILEGMDQFFMTLGSGGEIAALNYKVSKGVKLGLDPEVLAKTAAAKRVFRGEIGDNAGSHVLNGMDVLTNTILGLRNNDNKVVSTIAKFTLPFVKTPMNIFKQGVEYTPLGLSTIPGSTVKTEQLTKALLGSSIGLGTAMLVGSDRLTWAEPTSEKQKNAFRAAGMQPYAIKIGDKWISYSKMHPAIAFNLALVAATKDALDRKTIDDSQAETVLTALAKWVQFYADQSYMRNIGDFIGATKGAESGVAKYLSNYPTQLIPFRALMGWINRIIDPYQRQIDPTGSTLEKQMQYIQSQIPVLAQKLPTRNDTGGNPIPNQNRLLNAFSPARVTTENSARKNVYEGIMAKSQQTREVNALKDQAKRKAGSEGGVVDNIIVANDGSTIDLTPPTTGNGIDAFTNENWNYTKARQIWKAKTSGLIDESTASQAYSKLNVDEGDVRYDYIATKSNDIKTQYIMSKSLNHEQLLSRLVSGRVVSATGKQFASDGVVNNLRDEGLISDYEAKALKKLKVDKSGKPVGGAGRKSGRVRTAKAPKFGKAPTVKIKLGKANKKRLGSVRLGKAKTSKTRVKGYDSYESDLKKIARSTGAKV